MYNWNKNYCELSFTDSLICRDTDVSETLAGLVYGKSTAVGEYSNLNFIWTFNHKIAVFKTLPFAAIGIYSSRENIEN